MRQKNNINVALFAPMSGSLSEIGETSLEAMQIAREQIKDYDFIIISTHWTNHWMRKITQKIKYNVLLKHYIYQL